MPKLENKHYHVCRACLFGRNPHFKSDNLIISVDTVTEALKHFLVGRLH